MSTVKPTWRNLPHEGPHFTVNPDTGLGWRADCPSCMAEAVLRDNGMIAIPRPTRPPSLDVERLVQADANTPRSGARLWGESREAYWRRFAAEYARLTAARPPSLDVERAIEWLRTDDGCTCSGCVERRERYARLSEANDDDLASHLAVAMVEAGNPSQYPNIGQHAKAIVKALRRQQDARR